MRLFLLFIYVLYLQAAVFSERTATYHCDTKYFAYMPAHGNNEVIIHFFQWENNSTSPVYVEWNDKKQADLAVKTSETYATANSDNNMEKQDNGK
jgi:hypothetical protein